MRVLIIVPAYNEAESLPHVLGTLAEVVPEHDVCVVDDGSTDRTAEVARQHGVTVLESPLNLGIGGAVQTGYLWARHRGYDVAIQIDGDGQHDPRFIPEALKPIVKGEADLVVGSRFIAKDKGGFQSTAMRRMGIRYLSLLLRVRCGLKVTDPTSGFRLAARRALSLYADTYPSDYPEPEALGLAKRAGLRVAEVPVVMSERQHGESSINLFGAFYYLVKVTLAILLLPHVQRRDEAGRGEMRDEGA